jgi:hypothetical protein
LPFENLKKKYFRDLFDFLTICFYEYEHFFKDHQARILIMEENLIRELLPLAYDIVYNHIREDNDYAIALYF